MFQPLACANGRPIAVTVIFEAATSLGHVLATSALCVVLTLAQLFVTRRAVITKPRSLFHGGRARRQPDAAAAEQGIA